MSPTGVEGNLMSVGNKSPPRADSPVSNPSTSKRHQKRIAPEESVSLRHANLSSSAAEPYKAIAVPPKLQHGNPNSNRGSLAASQYRQAAGQPQQAHDNIIGVEGQHSMHDTDKESAFNSNGSNDRSVPEDWFKNWNTNVGDFNQPNPADGDSPYYLPSERQRRKQKHKVDQLKPAVGALPSTGTALGVPLLDPTQSTQLFNPTYPSMLPTQDSEDESDVYRSVIDDLTVKNKKLKKKLRKMERLHCNELNEEKLFEVRCYGLPPARKQELQELLQKFAADLEGGGGVYETKRSDAISNANATSSTNPSSSSLLQNTDSAYATETRMTSLDGGSVGVSKGQSQTGQIQEKLRPTPNINPEARPVQFANERAKMKLVVKRLEQLFTGSDALQSDLEKAKLQQQVAVEAAQEKLDSVIDELAESGDESDRREASIMASSGQEDSTGKSQQASEGKHRRSFDTSHQRPTRPMDLDPNRAQVAADNVEYLEHMSFSSSSKHLNFRPAAVGESTGWVYLNLINNMAQIHTLNVSLNFIKKSIRTMSDKLELSSDGNKVRWRGGLTGTRLASDGDTSSNGIENSSGGESSPGEISAAKSGDNTTPPEGKHGVKLTSVDPRSRMSQISSPAVTSGDVSGIDNFRYKPLMFHSLATQKSSSEDTSDADSSDSESEAGSNGSGGPPPILESGANVELSDIGKFAPLDGAVIYFGGAPFCTDLSAQIVFREGGHPFLKSKDSTFYNRIVDEPIGPPTSTEELEKEPLSPRPLSKFDWNLQDTEMDITDDADELLPELTSIETTPSETIPTAMPPPIPFNVSGLGGVRPDDNFVVYVKTEQKTVAPHSFRVQNLKRSSHMIPMDVLDAVSGGLSNTSTPWFETDITDAINIRLPPSKLPDPTIALSLSDSSPDPFASNSDEPRSYESHLSFAYNIEDDSRSSGEGIPSFHSPEIDDQSPMDLDAEEGMPLEGNPLAPLSVVATAGDLSQDGSEPGSPKEMPILQSLDDMDIGSMEML
ncbi:hypothetical protein ABW19_dt0203286 [Dactylella cylindrospora]|nr:hypothetical protein ABW19_dt0203286 [Dactylella cylindrospora]